MRTLLLSFLLILYHTANAEKNYIELGVTNLGSWGYSTSLDLSEINLFPTLNDNTKRNRKFVSFRKDMSSDFYLIGSYTETESTQEYTDPFQSANLNVCTVDGFANSSCLGSILNPLPTIKTTYNLKEKNILLGVGYEQPIYNYNSYVELSKYKYTASDNLLPLGVFLINSEFLGIGSSKKRSGNMFRVGVKKQLDSDMHFDVSYGTFTNLSISGSHNNKSVKLIKYLNSTVSLVLNHEKDEYTDGVSLLSRTNNSVSLRTKF